MSQLGNVRENVVILGSGQAIEETWMKAAEGRQGFAVNVIGPHAEFLANRAGSYKRLQLPDGVWRIQTQTPQEAGLVMDEIRRHCGSQGWPDRAERVNLGGTLVRAIDVLRGEGAGEIGPGLLAIRSTGQYDVELDGDGQPIAIRIRLA